MYFNKFPDIYYEFEIDGKLVLKTVKDITTNIRFRKEILENITLYDEYDIEDGDTPEIISAKFYGSPQYHWVIMLVNQRYDWLADYPMSSRTFQEYIADKYENPYGIHHYEKDGYVVMPDAPGAVAVTNYEHEEAVNESKRRVKLISPELLGRVLEQLKTLI